jgi:hypothetical protein
LTERYRCEQLSSGTLKLLEADRRDRVHEADHLSDVVAVRGGRRCRERDPVAVGDQMVL